MCDEAHDDDKPRRNPASSMEWLTKAIVNAPASPPPLFEAKIVGIPVLRIPADRKAESRIRGLAEKAVSGSQQLLPPSKPAKKGTKGSVSSGQPEATVEKCFAGANRCRNRRGNSLRYCIIYRSQDRRVCCKVSF